MYLVHTTSLVGGGLIMDEQELTLRKKLELLREKHRNLDEALSKITAMATVDELQLRRLKKEKLLLRDQICAIEDSLYPDIIA